ncbi:unnamed protein product [Closterium sp. NIES-53]
MVTITVVAVARGGQQRSLPLLDDPTPQQLREWVIQRGGGGFGFMWPQRPRDCASQRCVPGRIEADALGSSESAVAPGASESAAALGARESADALGASASTATGPASTKALHTFMLDSGASRCFFRDCTTVTPLAAAVPVSLADPTGGLVVARAYTVLPCPAVPSGMNGLTPSFPEDNVWRCVSAHKLAVRHLATFTRQPWTGLYTLTIASAHVAASSRVSTFGQLAASCSCRVLSHHTLLWHHRLGHPSLPRLRSMHSRLLVSGLPSSLPSLPRSLAPSCLPCVKGRQRAAPHSSEFPLTTAPLQTLHMDVWGPAPVGGTDQECYFLLVVDNYTRYTTIFLLRCKVDVSSVLIPWIRATRRLLHEWFRRDLPVLRLHSDKGGEFSSSLLAEFFRDEGICQTFTLPASPQQNGIAELHQLNLWPRVSEPETLPTLRWMGKVSDASVFRVWGALSLVRNAKASKLSSRCVFLSFPTSAPPWQFYHPRKHPLPPQGPSPSGVSQVDPTPLVEPLEISSDSSGLTKGGDPAADDTTATCRSPRLETPPGFPPRSTSPPPQPAVVDSGAESAGVEPGGAETEGEGSGGAATGGAGSGGAATGGADYGGDASPIGGGALGDPAGGAGAASPGGTAGAGGTGGTSGGAGGAAGARGTSGAGGAGSTSPRGATGDGGAGPTIPGGTASAGGAAGTGGAGAGGTGGAGAAGPGGARTGGAGAAGAAGAGGAVSAGGAVGTRAADTGGAGATGAGAAGAAGPGGACTRGTGAAGAGGAARADGATGAAAVTGGAGVAGGAASTRGARTRGAGAAEARGATGAGGGGSATRAAGSGDAGGATGATGSGGAGGTAGAGGAGARGTRGTGGAGCQNLGTSTNPNWVVPLMGYPTIAYTK